MNQLRGVKLPTLRYNTGPLSEDLLSVNGYSNLQTFFPTLSKLLHLGKLNSNDEIWMESKWRISSIDCSGTSGPCSVKLEQNTDISNNFVPENNPAFLKVTHLLDPLKWIQGDYTIPKEPGLPWHPKRWKTTWEKLQDPGNQAYIDTLCSYTVGRIREQDLSPHFNLFYGAFCARASKYLYNLTDDYQSYRYESWLWKGLKRELFKFKVVNGENVNEPVPQEIIDKLIEEYTDEDDKSIVLDMIPMDDNIDAGSIHSDSFSDISYHTKNDDMNKSASESDSDCSEGSDGSDGSDDSKYKIYAEIDNYPVMIIITERNVNTMDSLFENFDEVGASPGTPEWLNRWSAWIFQIIAALSVAQSLIGLTHNDLHTNNIVWSKTDDEFINYKLRSGMHFKVPTYGKVFRIIDYGRAIFRINGQRFISDDFKKGNDADGQYVFQPLVQKFKKEIPPNPSFDLARLTVSMIDGIFPNKPPVRDGGDVLSKEQGLVVMETTSELYNLIWSWMIDDMGRNIFVNPNGTERFPDFELYKHIAEYVHGAVPAKQFFTPVCQAFRVEEDQVSGKVYSLLY
jgi:hypothetical protein